MTSKKLIIAISLVSCIFFAGCRVGIKDADVFDRYQKTTLKLSDSADVLAYIQKGGDEFLSPSESTVASWGTIKKDSSLWFNIVAFDEEELTAIRKYCLTADEKSKTPVLWPTRRQRFNSQIMLSEKILKEPFANENFRRIAILKEIREKFGDDVIELIRDSQTLRSSTMMAKQTLKTIIVKLEQSPALAQTLTNVEGMDFDHMIFGPGKARMIIGSDIVELRVKIGRETFTKPIIP